MDAFFSCLLLSCLLPLSLLLLPLLFPSQLFLFTSKANYLASGLSNPLSACFVGVFFVCLSSYVLYELSRLRLICFKRSIDVSTAAERLENVCLFVCVCVCRCECMQAWTCACLSQYVPVLSLSRLKWMYSTVVKEKRRIEEESLFLLLFYTHTHTFTFLKSLSNKVSDSSALNPHVDNNFMNNFQLYLGHLIVLILLYKLQFWSIPDYQQYGFLGHIALVEM